MPIGFSEILVIGAVVVIVWNARRLPELGKAVGKTFASFRKGVSQDDDRPSRDVTPHS